MKMTIDKRYPRIFTLVAIGLMIVIGSTIPVTAMPPTPEIQEKIDNGEIRMPFMANFFPSMPANMKPNAPSATQSPSMAGPYKALCILVDFSDKTSQTSAFKFDTLVFADKVGTVRNFYQEVSYAQLDIVTVNLPSTIGWQRAPQTYAYYVDNNYGTDSPYPKNSQKLCEDLVDLVDGVVDFSQYDNDGNGYVDVVMIAHAGRGAELSGSSADIWSHKWNINPRNRDGVNICDYTIMPEYWYNPGDMTIGVYCHELGHVFGLPDLYDTDGSSNGTGYWSLMSSGSWNGSLGSSPAHPDAWSMIKLGWAAPTNITSNVTNVAIAAIENGGPIYRLWTSGADGDEYFLVENRQKQGYDASLPGAGLMIWHIDEAVWSNTNEWYPGHTTFGHYRVALEQADNQYHLERRLSLGDNGDPFPGSSSNISFSPTTSPSSDAYSASSSFVAITNISASASTMTADFAVSFAVSNDDDDDTPVLPKFALEQNYPNPFNPVTRFDYSIASPGEVEINIYNVTGQRIKRIVDGHHQAGVYTAVWDGTDANGEGVPSGVYLYELVTDEETTARKMLLMK
jgi:immune inhibitor A